MRRPGVVELDARARRAWPWLPATATSGSMWLGLDGEALRVAPDGSCAPVVVLGRKSVASDPTAGRRAA